MRPYDRLRLTDCPIFGFVYRVWGKVEGQATFLELFCLYLAIIGIELVSAPLPP